MPAAGGPATPLTKAEGSSSHRFPVFLPDGRQFLYHVALADGGTGGLRLASLDAPAGQRVLADQSSAAYAPPGARGGSGHLLFVRENVLMAQPVDPSSFAAAGDPFPLAEQVFFAPISGHAPVSASGSGIFAYQAGGNRAEHQLAWHDRTGKELAKVGTPGLLLGLALSPDEKRVALARGGPGGSTDLWLHELARGSDTRFTFSGGRNAEPVWSPDGRRLAFGSGRAGVSNLYHKDTSGAGQDEALLDPGSARFVTDWSRDGRFLLYSELTAKSQDIQVLPLDGDRKPISFLQTEFLESQGQFSPDGRWVAYTSDESGRLEVYVRPFPPTGPGGKWKVSIAGGQLPRWRRDGKELFYIAPDRKLMAAGVNAAAGPPPSFEASSPQALFETRMVPSTPGFNVFYYAVAGDGKRFLIASTAGETADAPVTVVVGGL